MTWLVTGGAGYIGAHVVRSFRAAGIEVAVIDSLSSGHRSFVPPEVPFIEGSILDQPSLEQILQDHDVVGVVHLAGFKYAGVSVERPIHTYDENVTGTLSLLRAMEAGGVERLVFSSSAATYGTPDVPIVTEQTPTRPESPYGESKLIGEWLIRAQARATGLRQTSLRYFNVVGSAHADLYDSSPHNLFPLVFKALANGDAPTIFGDDYDTPDGTCVRDYVHVGDLAEAHVAAARALDEGRSLEPVYNLGSGDGLSVKEIVEAILRVTGSDLTPTIGPRRPGDPARIVAAGDLAARDLDWALRHSLEEMVAGAWDAYQRTLTN